MYKKCIFTARKRSLRRLCFYRCLSVHGGGACVVAPGGHAWLFRGACVVVLGGMHGCSKGHAWLLQGGMCGCSGGCAWLLPGGHVWLLPGGACVVALGGHVWDTTRYRDTINERAVRILLECILVQIKFCSNSL